MINNVNVILVCSKVNKDLLHFILVNLDVLVMLLVITMSVQCPPKICVKQESTSEFHCEWFKFSLDEHFKRQPYKFLCVFSWRNVNGGVIESHAKA